MYQADRRQTYHPNETDEIEIRSLLRLDAYENESSQLHGICAIVKERNKEDCVDSVGEETVPTEMKDSRKRARSTSIRRGGFVKLMLNP